ncbi:ImcF-related family protein [Brenneria sp. g21c3]|uniref:ImcF-related family protein n=1 Tax=Brenneria sp. g21c3 TaxID=3093893 RepID=UPI002EC03F2C|nr:ImcF-related family protein [Brenneria sp. g21c3]
MEQENKSNNVSVSRTVILIFLSVTLLMLMIGFIWWWWVEDASPDRALIWRLIMSGLIIWGILLTLAFLALGNMSGFIKSMRFPSQPKPEKKIAPAAHDHDDIKTHLRNRYGRYWRRHVRILLVVGEAPQVEALAPGLTSQQWQEGSQTLLLWGGPAGTADSEQLARCRRLRRRRPLDGVVWALTAEQSQQSAAVDSARRQLDERARLLGWQAPVWLWEVQNSQWSQSERETQPVGCLLPSRCDPATLNDRLSQLVPRLTRAGIGQMMREPKHDFLLRLAQTLEAGGIARWHKTATALLSGVSVFPLRGILFSLPVTVRPGGVPHSWLPDPVWQGVLSDSKVVRGERLGLPWAKGIQWGIITLSVLAAAGSLLSFLSNRQDIRVGIERVQAATAPDRSLTARLQNVQALQQAIVRLQHDAPWYGHFGLNQRDALLQALWPHYFIAQRALIRDTAARHLAASLRDMLRLPPAVRQEAKYTRAGYAQLKAYLMLAHPEKTEPDFLSAVLTENPPDQSGAAGGVWQEISPALFRFYADNLAAHPEWRIEPDRALIEDVRRGLLDQMGMSQTETTLYQRLLAQAASGYADMTIERMAGDTDASLLFVSDGVVPGMFTRQAWEEQVKPAIAQIADERRREMDWVLSDGKQPLADGVSSGQLQARLTARYFRDFSGAWLDFLNDVRWRRAEDLADVTEQLRLMADTRRSPLLALINTLVWQGKTGQSPQRVAEALSQSALATLQRKTGVPASGGSDLPGERPGPLDETFGPWLALAEGTPGAAAPNLPTYLTRVSQLRLKLRQVMDSADPQAMTQALAQRVFQGNAAELTAIWDYGRLLAESLGSEWGGVGQTLFVQPLAQSRRQLLQPAAQSLNARWQRSVVNDWRHAFTGRYPFADTGNDASLPLLSLYLRADTGRIEQFLHTQLGGLLRKEGNRWVPAAQHSRGVTFNPRFLTAINQLSMLSDTLLAQGDAGIRFELMPRATREVAQTMLTVDGQTLNYFNQMESWQRFRWPGESYKPGAILSWQSNNTGVRLYANEAGVWGWMRLLEKAKVEQLDGSRFRVVWRTPEGQPLTYILRSELGGGPLALLTLRDFHLPAQIFIIDGAAGE